MAIRRPRAQRDQSGERPANGRARRLSTRSRVGVLTRTVHECREDNVTIWAAALTYFGILSIFPALLALVSILGLVGQSATQPLLDNVSTIAPGPAKEILTGALQGLENSSGTAGLTFLVGLAAALWSASGYVSAFMRASNVIYDVGEGRPIWKTLPVRLGVTVVTVLLLAVSAVAVVITGPLAEEVGNVIGLGSAAVTAWDVAKWPVLVLIVSLMFAVLYWASPNVKHQRFRLVTPGSLVAVLLWIVASAAFAFYVANFGSYNKTYGALGGVVCFLVWLWLSNIVILVGAELDAEVARGRQIEAGHPRDKEPFLEPRDTRKLKTS
jgi:membrane protein